MMGYNCKTTDHMKKHVLVWKKVQQMLAWGFLCMLMTACSVVRGYMTDGKDGPGIYSRYAV